MPRPTVRDRDFPLAFLAALLALPVASCKSHPAEPVQPNVIDVNHKGATATDKNVKPGSSTSKPSAARQETAEEKAAVAALHVPTKLMVSVGALHITSLEGKTPANASVPKAPTIHGVGSKMPFAAIVMDHYNEKVSAAVPKIAFDDPSIATTSDDGKSIVAKAYGSAVMSISVGDVQQRVQISVDPIDRTTISVPSSKIMIHVGSKQKLAPVVHEHTGELISEATFQYQSRNPAIALVDPAGIVLGLSPGETAIRIQSGEQQVVLNVTVVP